MSADTVHRMIGRALTDRHFREVLLRSPQRVIEEYALSHQERAVISSLQAVTLEEFSQQLSEGLKGEGGGTREG